MHALRWRYLNLIIYIQGVRLLYVRRRDGIFRKSKRPPGGRHLHDAPEHRNELRGQLARHPILMDGGSPNLEEVRRRH